MKEWKVDYEPKGMLDRGDIYTYEINGQVVARFSQNGGWGRGIQTLTKNIIHPFGKLEYDQSISGDLSLDDTKKAIEQKYEDVK